MTCIAGLIDKNGVVWMGSDSCEHDENQYREGIAKVFLKDTFLVGTAGDSDASDAVRFRFPFPPVPFDLSIYDYLGQYFVPQCFDFLLNDLDIARKNKGRGEKHVDCILLVGIRKRLYCVDIGERVVLASGRDYDAIGAGSHPAEGVLADLTGRVQSPTQKLLRALRASEACTVGVTGPFYILNDRGFERKYLH